jgi:predicted lysophospholipase L1 biosynthesis ABC-type transport system permease subunit
VLAGREFTAADHATAPRVAIVNAGFVSRHMADGTALGRVTDAGPCADAPCTVVGVVGDVLYGASMRDSAPPTVYVPLAQSTDALPPGRLIRVTLRSEAPAAQPSVAAVASALDRVDSRLTFSTRPLMEDVRQSSAQERLLAAVASVFGWLALLLSGLGVYGVTSYAVRRRRQELAIRFALGADRRSIIALVVGQMARRLALGVAIGLPAAFWLSRFVSSLLFGVDPMSVSSAAAVAATLGVVGAVAAWAPARHAARIGPAGLR